MNVSLHLISFLTTCPFGQKRWKITCPKLLLLSTQYAAILNIFKSMFLSSFGYLEKEKQLNISFISTFNSIKESNGGNSIFSHFIVWTLNHHFLQEERTICRNFSLAQMSKLLFELLFEKHVIAVIKIHRRKKCALCSIWTDDRRNTSMMLYQLSS